MSAVLPTSVDGLDRDGARALRRLLLAATAAAGRAERDPALPALVAAAPIERLPEAAALHRVGGCVHAALTPVAGVPPDVLAALGAQRSEAARYHLRYCQALVELARAFGDLPWVVMKGPVLSSSVYRDPGLRTYGDIDLLIDQRAFPAAVASIEALGYEHLIRNWPLHEWFMASELQMHRGSVNLDVHWHMVFARWERRFFSIDPAAMLANARLVVVGGHEVPTFDAVDTVLHLGLHASRAGGHRLIWSKDIERALAVLQPDLDALVDRAHAFGCGPPVGLALERAQRLLGADVPLATIEALTGRALRGLERGLARVTPTIRFDERQSVPRFLARSTRSRLPVAMLELATRAGRAVRRQFGRRPHETADPIEKESYLQAVTRAHRLRPRSGGRLGRGGRLAARFARRRHLLGVGLALADVQLLLRLVDEVAGLLGEVAGLLLDRVGDLLLDLVDDLAGLVGDVASDVLGLVHEAHRGLLAVGRVPGRGGG